MKILVVDDDFADRMFLKNLVSCYGVCDTAANGLEAIKAFQGACEQKNYYQIIFLDVMMPFMDGLGVLKLIREMEKQRNIHEKNRAKIVMISALNDKSTKDNAFFLGCDGYLPKPIDLSILQQEIEKLRVLVR